MKNKYFLILGLLFLMLACSSFKYKYYGILPSQGLLLGKQPKDDRPLSVCEPDEAVKGKCVVMFTDEFERVRADIVDLTERLKACESQ